MDSVILNGVEYVKKPDATNLVLVRTFSAGVHVGELESRNDKNVVLKNARRIWRWRGANTLNEISQKALKALRSLNILELANPCQRSF